MWEAFKHFQDSLREGMANQSLPSNPGYGIRTRGQQSSMPQPMGDSFKRIKDVFTTGGVSPASYGGNPMSFGSSFNRIKSLFDPMSQKTLRSFTPSHGAGSPIPFGDQQSAMARPYTMRDNYT